MQVDRKLMSEMTVNDNLRSQSKSHKCLPKKNMGPGTTRQSSIGVNTGNVLNTGSDNYIHRGSIQLGPEKHRDEQ